MSAKWRKSKICNHFECIPLVCELFIKAKSIFRMFISPGALSILWKCIFILVFIRLGSTSEIRNDIDEREIFLVFTFRADTGNEEKVDAFADHWTCKKHFQQYTYMTEEHSEIAIPITVPRENAYFRFTFLIEVWHDCQIGSL